MEQMKYLLVVLILCVPGHWCRKKRERYAIVNGPLPPAPITTVQRLLHTSYEKNDRPFKDAFRDTPVEVRLGFRFNDVWIQFGDMTMSLQFDVRYEWQDPRLSYKHTLVGKVGNEVTLNPSYMKKLWLPDIYFANALTVERVTDPVLNAMLKLNSTGHLILMQRFNIKVRCPEMKDNFAEGNEFECPLKVGAYASTAEELMLSWLEGPVVFDSHISLPDVVIQDTIKYRCSSRLITGTFSCAEIAFLLRPRSRYRYPF